MNIQLERFAGNTFASVVTGLSRAPGSPSPGVRGRSQQGRIRVNRIVWSQTVPVEHVDFEVSRSIDDGVVGAWKVKVTYHIEKMFMDGSSAHVGIDIDDGERMVATVRFRDEADVEGFTIQAECTAPGLS